MKLSLVVLTPGTTEGKEIPVTLTQFSIGRDPKCNLRPASSIISKRHCAIYVRSGKVFVKDFDSTNGTFINEERIAGERELHHQDKLSIGPLLFGVKLESSTPVDRQTPVPPIRAGAKSGDDDEAAAMLLALADADAPPAGSARLDGEGVPTGSTIMEIPPLLEGAKEEEAAAGGAERMQKAAKNEADTSAAAKALLDKYIRRPRV